MTMKLIWKPVEIALCVCLATVGPLAAETDVKSNVKVKDGKDVEVTGCVASSPSGTGDSYMLTNVADKKGTKPNYMLVADGHDVAKHVGHRVQISGKATDRDGKVEIETKTKTKVKGDEQETKSKSTLKGDVPGMPYLSVKSMKMIAATCP
jgi:RecJ-like exonuclease